jgi:diadenosine tetraphosphate (Ap4A) HIT family hydrolase
MILHSDFASKTPVTKLQHSIVLMEDCQPNPWLIIVPDTGKSPLDAVDITDLDFDLQVKILHEVNICANVIKAMFKPYKLNIASFGNVTPQLHIHIQARFKHDEHFAKPLFGLVNRGFTDSQTRLEAALAIKNAIEAKF